MRGLDFVGLGNPEDYEKTVDDPDLWDPRAGAAWPPCSWPTTSTQAARGAQGAPSRAGADARPRAVPA